MYVIMIFKKREKFGGPPKKSPRPTIVTPGIHGCQKNEILYHKQSLFKVLGSTRGLTSIKG